MLTATDASGAVDTQSFTITVSNVNDAPTVTSTAPTSSTEDSAYSYTVAASDVETGDTVTYAATSLPSWLAFDAGKGGCPLILLEILLLKTSAQLRIPLHG